MCVLQPQRIVILPLVGLPFQVPTISRHFKLYQRPSTDCGFSVLMGVSFESTFFLITHFTAFPFHLVYFCLFPFPLRCPVCSTLILWFPMNRMQIIRHFVAHNPYDSDNLSLRQSMPHKLTHTHTLRERDYLLHISFYSGLNNLSWRKKSEIKWTAKYQH